MPSSSGRIVPLLPAVFILALAGCAAPAMEGGSPLRRAQMSPDSCVLEVFFVRFPFGDPEVNDRLWREVDEQQFPVGLRRRLARNGFRIGLLGGQVPVTLARLLELKDKAPPPGTPSQVNVAELDSDPRVVGWHLQVRSDRRKEIVTSAVHDRLTVLLSEPGQLTGQTYSQAQAVLGLRTRPLGDGRVRLELVPELHHGDVRRRYVGQQGMLRLEAGKPRRVFEEMAFSATLAPGDMLLLSSLPNRPGSLGHHFLTEEDGQLEQKLLVLRLSQTQHDDLFSPLGRLHLEE